MVDLIHGLTAEVVARNLARAREAIAAAGRDPGEVEILAAVKYLPAEELAALADGGVTVVGENRAQELEAKAAAAPGRFTLGLHRPAAEPQGQGCPASRPLHPFRRVGLGAGPARSSRRPRHARSSIEVNVAGEAGKSGISPRRAARFPGPLSGVGGGPDDHAALHRRPRGAAAPISRRCGVWPRLTGCPSSPWGPVRTTSSPLQKGPRSCDLVRVCSAMAAERVIITGRESPQMREP